MTNYFSFKVLHQSRKSRARVGEIHTPHGIINTPSFVAVGTNGTLKAVDSQTVASLGLELMFCNTYHLMVQPGTGIIKKAGGLHAFMKRSTPIITDSGGFQVFSLAYGGVHNEIKSKGKKQHNNSVLSITEEGVLFRSYRDGTPILLTPESSIQAQKDLGADIIIPFDELPPYHIGAQVLKKSLDRTHRWEKRSLDMHLANKAEQAMYGVIHGGVDRQLRSESCSYLSTLEFDGFAIGGSVGKTEHELADVVNYVTPLLPETKPIHLLGIGDLRSIATGILAGVDTFDSSHPTKCARHGLLFIKGGTLKIMQSMYKEDFATIDQACSCFVCLHYSRAYLHHLFKAHEMSAYSLASIHNIAAMIEYMKEYRAKIYNDEL